MSKDSSSRLIRAKTPVLSLKSNGVGPIITECTRTYSEGLFLA